MGGGQSSDSCAQRVPGDYEAVIRVHVDSLQDFRDHNRPSFSPRIPKAMVDFTSIAEVCRFLGPVEVREPVLRRTRSPESKDDDLVHVVDCDESRVVRLDGVLELGNGRGIRRLDELAVATRTGDLGSRGVVVVCTVSCSGIPSIEVELREKLFGYPIVLGVLWRLRLSTAGDDPGPVEIKRALFERQGESRECAGGDHRNEDCDQGTGEDPWGRRDSDRGCRDKDRKP